MTDRLPTAASCWPTLPAMLRKFDRLARQARFTGSTPEEFAVWRAETRVLLQKLLGLDKMELPHLWEHLDMGDIASLIAPRSLWVQTCREDRLNGPPWSRERRGAGGGGKGCLCPAGCAGPAAP